MRGFWAGLAALTATLVLLAPVSGSLGASETEVDSLRLGSLGDGHQATGTVLLKAGVRYHLVVTGYVTQAGRDSTLGSYADDAFYHFQDSRHPGAPSPPGILFLGLRFADAAGRVDFIRTFAEDQRVPPYAQGHRYENHFTLKEDARLLISATGLGDSNFTYGGPGFVVSVFSGGGPPPAPHPSPGPPLGGRCGPISAAAHAAAAVPAPLFCFTDQWGRLLDFGHLQPGSDAVGASPPLGKTEKAKVTVGGLTDEDSEVLARLTGSKRGSLKAECLLQFREAVGNLPANETTTPGVNELQVREYLFTLVACLDVARVVDAIITSRATATPAQVPTCALTGFRVTVAPRRGRPAQVRVTAGGAPNGPLHVTCVRSQGQIQLTVASRTRGVPLSRFVGPRLQIGIVRSLRDPTAGDIAVRFDRS
ncbi:MAG: hypothetical protein QOH12_2910 [Solirubrobacteraceae bacterium]|jgi:hypothetical protein|nr:hypothetical protein [Solirubrobacteraceae bacterium]